MDSNYSLADIKSALGGDEDGFSFGGIGGLILILLFFFMFRGNLWGNGEDKEDYVTQAEFQQGLFSQTSDNALRGISDQLCQTNYNMATGDNAIQRDIAATSAGVQSAICENRYTTQLGFQNLGTQMAQCCCETQKTIIEQNQATRDAINQLKIDELGDKLAVARAQVSNFEQSQYLLGSLGRFVSNPPCPCMCGTTVI